MVDGRFSLYDLFNLIALTAFVLAGEVLDRWKDMSSSVRNAWID
jgi:hypothetical protein